MRFNTAQVLDLVCVPKETLRHWKTVLPPIQQRDGRSAQYTFAELVALSVIAAAVQGLAIPISRFTSDAEWLFNEIANWLEAGSSSAYFHILPSEVRFDSSLESEDVAVVCVVAVHIVVHHLKAKLAQPNEEAKASQLALPFE
jgi:hypothetical protein